MDPFTIVTAALSTVLGLVSLALAILFFVWANAATKESASVLGEAKQTLQRVDSAIGLLKDETFTLLRDSQSDFRRLVFAEVKRGESQPLPSEPAVAPGESVAPPGDYVDTSTNDIDVVKVGLSLREHMKQKRGEHFTRDLARLQKRLISEFDNAAPNGILTNGELAERLKPDGFDVGEVVFAVADLTQRGELSGPTRQAK